MKFDEYQALSACNWSTLKAMRQSPLAYLTATKEQREDNDALRLGRATHCAVLEPEEFPKRYRVWTGGIRRGKSWDEFAAACEQDEVTYLTEEQYARCIMVRNSVRNHPLVIPYLREGEAEKVITWRDEATGIELKSRLDWLCPDPENAGELVVADLKTARHASNPRRFAASAHDLGYMSQMAFYCNAVKAVTGKEPRAVIVAVEPVSPFDVTVYRVSEDAMYFSQHEIKRLLEKLNQCRTQDSWPGAHTTEQVLELPRWSVPEIDDENEEPEWLRGA